MADDTVTAVGKREMTFIPSFAIKNLRRAIEIELATKGEKHRDAAKRADVTPTWWSRLINNNEITENDLKVIAKGLGYSVAKLKQRLTIVQKV